MSYFNSFEFMSLQQNEENEIPLLDKIRTEKNKYGFLNCFSHNFGDIEKMTHVIGHDRDSCSRKAKIIRESAQFWQLFHLFKSRLILTEDL